MIPKTKDKVAEKDVKFEKIKQKSDIDNSKCIECGVEFTTDVTVNRLPRKGFMILLEDEDKSIPYCSKCFNKIPIGQIISYEGIK